MMQNYFSNTSKPAVMNMPDYHTELEWLIHNLWNRSSTFKFKVPDTLVLKDCDIENWYFTSSCGTILKKNKTTNTAFNMEKKIMTGLHTNFEHVAATAYHFDFKSENLRLKNDTITLEHISTHDFKNFAGIIDRTIEKGAKTSVFKIPQIVQKFVYSKSSKN